MSKIYIAGPFFDPSQIAIIEAIKKELDTLGLTYFSPKDESMFKQGDDPQDILNLNCAAITSASAIVVVTDGKDVGTMWEAGFAYARGIPIVYVWLGRREGQKFNLMLAASGNVVHTINDMSKELYNLYSTGRFVNTKYEGLME